MIFITLHTETWNFKTRKDISKKLLINAEKIDFIREENGETLIGLNGATTVVKETMNEVLKLINTERGI